MQADPEPVRLVVRPRLGGERALDLGRRRDRVARAREREEDAVAGPVDLGAAVRGGGLAHELAHPRARAGANRSPRRCSSRVEPSTSAKRSVTVPAGKRRCGVSVRVHAPSLGARRLGVHCRAVFDTLSDKLQATLGGLGRSGQPRRGGDLEGDARDSPRAARGGRQPRGRPRLHRVGQGARARAGRPQEPDAGPAGREDRPRGAHRAHGLGRLAPRVRASADGDPPRGPAGLGQDDGGRKARAAPAQGRQAARARRVRPPATRSGRPARAARQADPDPRLRARPQAIPSRRRGSGSTPRARTGSTS